MAVLVRNNKNNVVATKEVTELTFELDDGLLVLFKPCGVEDLLGLPPYDGVDDELLATKDLSQQPHFPAANSEDVKTMLQCGQRFGGMVYILLIARVGT